MINLELAKRLVTTMSDYDPELACMNQDELLTETLAELEKPDGMKLIIDGLLDVIEDLQS